MTAAGIIGEYNPLHRGHTFLFEETRRQLGTPIVTCMSGDFVQRAAPAVVRRQVRAEAAARSGADLVLELPLPWAVSSAEGFAEGAVDVLTASGVVDVLAFGSESGDTDRIRQAAETLLRPDFPGVLHRELRRGDPFPSARQRAVEALAGEKTAAVLSRPNDLLAVEYVKAILRRGLNMDLLAVPRRGAGHHEAAVPDGQPASASAIRALLYAGETKRAFPLMAPAMAEGYRREAAAGRAPVSGEPLERAVLYRLRSMSREDFAALDSGHEGLCNRLYTASRDAVSVSEVLSRAKTRRYPLSRLRRMILWAFLGLTTCPGAVPCLRPLAMTSAGRALLSQMRGHAALPVLTRPAAVRTLGPDAQTLFSLEARAASLYALAFPALSASGTSLWREVPVLTECCPSPGRPAPERSFP